MNSVKLNKKHLFTFIVTLVLLFSLNLNTFAVTNHTVNFYPYDFIAYYNPSSGGATNCTDTTKKSNMTSTINGTQYHVTQYKFSSLYSLYRKSLISGADLQIYTDTDYKFDFYIRCGEVSGCNSSVLVTLVFANDSDAGAVVTIFEKDNFQSNSWLHCTGSFKTPDLSGSVSCAMVVQVAQEPNSNNLCGNIIQLSDMNLVLDDPLLNGTPIETPSTDDLDNALNDYEDVMSGLPSVDGEELDRLMNFDFDSFTAGMSFVRDMFDRTLSVFGFSTVLSFALAIGLATYIIGRRVG